MTFSIINPPELHDPSSFGYSHSVLLPAGCDLVLVAGQYGSDPSGQVVSPVFAEQVRRAFENVGSVLAAQSLGLADVVQLRTYVVDHDLEKLGIIAQVVGGIWGATPPTHTVIGVARLATPDITFEVEAVAARA